MSVAALEARKKDVHVLSRYKEGPLIPFINHEMQKHRTSPVHLM